MPAVPSFLIEPIWAQFEHLIPVVVDTHPLGCHRRRIPDRIVFDKLVQVLVLGCSYAKIADSSCSATTIRDRRNEWIEAGIFTQLEQIALEGYHTMIGLDLENVAVDGCIVKAPCGGEAAGRSPVDRGKQGTKRSLLVDGSGIPLGTVVAAANRHDSPLQATRRWPVERTNSWHNRGFKKLAICTERHTRVIDAFIALANAIIIVRRLIRQGWTRYRWNGRPNRKP